MSADIKLEKLQESLQTRRFGKCIYFSRCVNSTNDWAKELASSGAEEGTVTVAQTQTAGRGRAGREWISPRGGLWFSIVLKPTKRAREASQLVFVASLVVAEVLQEKYGLKTETKWPNDVLVNDKKICGILTEMRTKEERVNFAIVGVGVNANFLVDEVLPASVKAVATSVEFELRKRIRLESLLRALLEKMENVYERYERAGFAPVLEEWKRYAGFLGRSVVVTDRNERLNGLALDVDVEGALILRLEDGTTRRIFVGDVALVSGVPD